MEQFGKIWEQYSWQEISERLKEVRVEDVRRSIKKQKRDLDDFLVLIAPAAQSELESMARLSGAQTRKRFGRTIQLYAPLYLSNECQNICTYCGFSLENPVRRRTLNDREILEEAAVLQSMGVEHVLLVTGEANNRVNLLYFLNAIALLRPYFVHISLEVQPLSEQEYRLLQEAGVYAILVYQETYHKEAYKQYHPKGKKSNFDFRLDTPDRIGRAGLHKTGLGVLLGLEDWRVDSFFTAVHIDYLQKRYWQSRYSVSFPRLRPAEGIIEPNFIMKDRDLLQLICAYRLWNEDLELSLSTREHALFRDHVIPLGITSMSAASKTNPGGYSVDPQSLEQFEISDERSLAEIMDVIRRAGYDPVRKDWHRAYCGTGDMVRGA